MSTVQAQWGLETTTNGMFEFSRDLMIACKRDSVQPLAILACQQFGNTLAISSETYHRVEELVLTSPEPVAINFLKATVGFYRDDCATQLGSNAAGIRFMALASALVNSLHVAEAGRAIHKMISETASDAMLVPTFAQVNALVNSIEARCHRCGFADEVVDYALLISRTSGFSSTRSHFSSFFERSGFRMRSWQPSYQMIGELVAAFRQLYRTEAPKVIGLTIVATSTVPWIAAFAKWCTGVSPTIRLDDATDGEGLEQPGSPITILVTSKALIGISIRTEYSFGAPTDLAVPHEMPYDIMRTSLAMINVQSYGQVLIERLRRVSGSDSPTTALEGILRILIRIFSAPRFPSRQASNEGWTVRNIDPFPKVQDMWDTYIKLFDIKGPENLSEGDTDPVHQANLEFAKWLQQFEGCKCLNCSSNQDRSALSRFLDRPTKGRSKKRSKSVTSGSTSGSDSGSDGSVSNESKSCRSKPKCLSKEKLAANLGFIIAEALCISLLPVSSDLRLPLRTDGLFWLGGYWNLDCLINEWCDKGFLSYPTSTAFDNEAEWSRRLFLNIELKMSQLFRIKVNEYHGRVVMLSGFGQVTYPLIFETNQIPVQGYLCRAVIPGSLRLQNETIVEVRTMGMPNVLPSLDYGFIQNTTGYALISPVNYYPDLLTSWRFKLEKEGVLSVILAAKKADGQASRYRVDPLEGISRLAAAVSLESCLHDPQSKLSEIDHNLAFGGIGFGKGAPWKNSNIITVVPIAGAEDLRLLMLGCFEEPRFARGLGDKASVVLRGKACIACCLKLCREVGARGLIL